MKTKRQREESVMRRVRVLMHRAEQLLWKAALTVEKAAYLPDVDLRASGRLQQLTELILHLKEQLETLRYADD